MCQRYGSKSTNGKIAVNWDTILTSVRMVSQLTAIYNRCKLIGPISPPSDGFRYILTTIDMCSRFPEAISLKDISSSTVAEALLEIFSRVGLPNRIHSDRGSQFTSDMMKEVYRLLDIKQSTTTPYHAMGNGLVENFNKTISAKESCSGKASELASIFGTTHVCSEGYPTGQYRIHTI